MVDKFKKRRRVFIKIFGGLLTVFFIASMINLFRIEKHLLTFMAFLLQVVFWLGLYYFQAVRYDDEKITAQYGWPKIYDNKITSMNYTEPSRY